MRSALRARPGTRRRRSPFSRLAGLQVWQGLGDPWREFDAVAAACAGLMGIAAGELVGRRTRRSPSGAAAAPEAVLQGGDGPRAPRASAAISKTT